MGVGYPAPTKILTFLTSSSAEHSAESIHRRPHYAGFCAVLSWTRLELSARTVFHLLIMSAIYAVRTERNKSTCHYDEACGVKQSHLPIFSGPEDRFDVARKARFSSEWQHQSLYVRSEGSQDFIWRCHTPKRTLTNIACLSMIASYINIYKVE